MSLNAPLTLYRFESRLLTGLVIDQDNSNTLVNLTSGAGGTHGALATMEFQVKARPGAADPPLIAKSIGVGITIPAQTGTNLGRYNIQLDPADFSTVPAGLYYYDLMTTWAGDGFRIYLVKPSILMLKDVVNPI